MKFFFTSPQPDRRLSWREQHGRLGLCFFVSGERVLRSLPWMWASRRLASEARLLLSQVVDREGRIVPPPLAAACVRVHVPAYRCVNFGSFAKACHGKSFYSGFLLILEQQRAHKYYSLTKNRECATFPSTTSDRQRARVKRKNVCKSKAWRDGANLKAHIASRSLPREIPVRGRFFRTPFSTTFRWRIFLNPTRIDQSVPQEPISVKNSKSTNSPNFSFNQGSWHVPLIFFPIVYYFNENNCGGMCRPTNAPNEALLHVHLPEGWSWPYGERWQRNTQFCHSLAWRL